MVHPDRANYPLNIILTASLLLSRTTWCRSSLSPSGLLLSLSSGKPAPPDRTQSPPVNSLHQDYSKNWLPTFSSSLLCSRFHQRWTNLCRLLLLPKLHGPVHQCREVLNSLPQWWLPPIFQRVWSRGSIEGEGSTHEQLGGVQGSGGGWDEGVRRRPRWRGQEASEMKGSGGRWDEGVRRQQQQSHREPTAA